jgi:hypothetical protein
MHKSCGGEFEVIWVAFWLDLEFAEHNDKHNEEELEKAGY